MAALRGPATEGMSVKQTSVPLTEMTRLVLKFLTSDTWTWAKTVDACWALCHLRHDSPSEVSPAFAESEL